MVVYIVLDAAMLSKAELTQIDILVHKPECQVFPPNLMFVLLPPIFLSKQSGQKTQLYEILC